MGGKDAMLFVPACCGPPSYRGGRVGVDRQLPSTVNCSNILRLYIGFGVGMDFVHHGLERILPNPRRLLSSSAANSSLLPLDDQVTYHSQARARCQCCSANIVRVEHWIIVIRYRDSQLRANRAPLVEGLLSAKP